MEFLQFGRGVDVTRLREDFGYQPAYTTATAFDDFVAGRGLTRYIDPERVASVEQRLLAQVERRRPVNA
jgi:UDP-glucose 4-epimerase